jgi:hypothetical protein
MTDKNLEQRYRRLLAWYPHEQRDEMLGVVMAGAGDRRRPGWRESADLLWGAVRVRSRRALTSDDRRDALAIVSLLAPIVLLTGATDELHEVGWFVVNGGWSGVPWIATIPTLPVWVAWFAVVVLAFLGLRRTAATGAWLAAAGFAVLTAWDPGGHWWVGKTAGLLVLSVLAAVALTVTRGPARWRELVGWGRLTVLCVAAAAVVALGTTGFHVRAAQILAGVIMAVCTVIACGSRSRAGRRAALVLLVPSVAALVANTADRYVFMTPTTGIVLSYGVPLVVLGLVGGVLSRVDRTTAG